MNAVQTPQQFAESYDLIATPPPAGAPPTQPGQYVVYITQTGDRWDTVANNFYGDPTQISALIFANPAVPIQDVFDAGVALAIPLIAPPTPAPSTVPLPWET